MRLIRIIYRNIVNAFKSIFRNFALSSASLICTTITLIVVAIALLTAGNINHFIDSLSDNLTIVVFVDSGATEQEIKNIETGIAEIEAVKADETIYKDKKKIKEETLEKSKKGSTINNIVSTWDDNNNPLNPVFIIKVKELGQLEKTANKISKMDKVASLKYSKDVEDRMLTVVKVVKQITIWIIVGLVIVTVFLIGNTTRLIIYSRSEEIEIMRLVGTSNPIIKLPFVIEGTILGILGSIIPIVATIWGYTIFYEKLGGYFYSGAIELLSATPFTIYASLILLGIGTAVGMVGSYVAVRRYLKV